jgi:hypothetical protein
VTVTPHDAIAQQNTTREKRQKIGTAIDRLPKVNADNFPARPAINGNFLLKAS